jgi:oligopeptide transport system substrate-binding protein
MNRRKARPWLTSGRVPLIVLTSGLVVLSACGSDNDRIEVPSENAARELVRGLGGEPDTFDPQQSKTVETHTVLRDLCEALATIDRNGNVAPGAAQSWSMERSTNSYTFRLRPNLKWSNGDTLVATDYVRALQRVVDPAVASSYAQMLAVVRGAPAIIAGEAPASALGVRAADELTLVVELASPISHLPALLSHPSTCPTHATRVAVAGEASAAVRGPWNGAYTIDRWSPRQDLVLRKNPNYWNASGVTIERVRYALATDTRVELRRYRAGELELTYNIPTEAIEEAQRDFGAQVRISPSLSTHYIGFRVDRGEVSSNPMLREALSAAIDRESLARKALNGAVLPAYSIVPPGTAGGAPPTLTWTNWDTAKRKAYAQELYAKAGFSEKAPANISLHYNTNDVVSKAMVAVAAMWKEVLGANVTLATTDTAAYFADLAAGKHEVFRSSWGADYNDPMAFLEVFAGGPETNFLRFSNLGYRALLDQANADPDAAHRAATLAAAEKILLDEHSLIPLYHGSNRNIVSPDIDGFSSTPLRVTLSQWLSWKPMRQ